MGGAGDISALLWEAARVFVFFLPHGLGDVGLELALFLKELDGGGLVLPRVATERQHGRYPLGRLRSDQGLGTLGHFSPCRLTVSSAHPDEGLATTKSDIISSDP